MCVAFHRRLERKVRQRKPIAHGIMIAPFMTQNMLIPHASHRPDNRSTGLQRIHSVPVPNLRSAAAQDSRQRSSDHRGNSGRFFSGLSHIGAVVIKDSHTKPYGWYLEPHCSS